MPRKQGSRNYPAIGLPDAIEKTRLIYAKDHRNEMAAHVVASHIGYQGLSGTSATVISALKKYGLLEGRGDAIRVSDDAVTILVDNEDSQERQDAIRRAAWRPEVFEELHSKFGDQFSDRNARAYLEKSGFISKGAEAIVRAYRETINFLSDQQAAYNGSGSSGNSETMEPIIMETTQPKTQAAGIREIPLPLASGTWPVLKGSFPMSPEAWEQMIALLQAMKPGLVRKEIE